MKKSSISRRGFVKELATTALSSTIIPSWAWGQGLISGSNMQGEGSGGDISTIPKFFDCNKYLGTGFTKRPDFPGIPDLLSHMEWCGSFLNTEDWRETLERLGNRRLIYGSDFISWETQWGHSPAWEMGRLLSLDVPDETLLRILGENMREILAKRR